jgi:hypothetical protein
MAIETTVAPSETNAAAGETKPAYLLVMEGQGDTSVKLVTPVIWEWVHSGATTGRQRNASGHLDSGWYDGDTPASVEAFLKATGQPLPFVTCGSLDNDRALQAVGEDVLYDEYSGDEAVENAEDYARDHGYTIVDRELWCIY